MVYNENRLSALSAEESDKRLFLEDDYLDRIDTEGHGLLETALDISSEEKSVMDFLIEYDMISILAQNASNKSVVTEAVINEGLTDKAELFKSKIEDVIVKTKNSILLSGAKVNKSYKKLFESDKEKIDTCISNMGNIKNFKDFKGIPNFEFPNENTSNIINSISRIKETDKIDLSKAIDNPEYLSKSILDITNSYIEDSKKALYKSESNWIPTKNQLKIMKEYAKSNIVRSSIAKLTKKTVSSLNSFEKSAFALCKKLDKNEDSDKKLKVLYNTVCKICRLYIKQFDNCRNLQIREIGAIRKAILICGNHCSKSIKESVQKQYELAIIISETSDELLKDIFE